MKTTSKIYEQEKRVNKLLWQITTRNIKAVHPETGGSMHLAHNWGNELAQQCIELHREREHKLNKLFAAHYHKAFCIQYPDHAAAKQLNDLYETSQL